MHDPDAPLFEALGGESGIASLVFRFYEAMDTRQDAKRIRALHPQDLTEVQRVFVSFLVMWSGGPQGYYAERGHPRLRRRHLDFPIDAAGRDTWVACMDDALDAHPLMESVRIELKDTFRKLAAHIQNH